MRRVYYSFVLRLLTHTTTVLLVVLAASVYALGYLVHVQAILHNAAQVRLGDIGPFIFRLLMHADVLTLCVLGVMIMTALSIPFSLPNYHRTVRPQAA